MAMSSWIRVFPPRVKRQISNGIEYGVCFGFLRGSLLYLLSFAWPSVRGRQIKVAIPGSTALAAVRLGTTDVNVFNCIYHQGEYNWDLPARPEVIVDAGAYTGLSTIYFATRYPGARIIAIEPSDYNFELLEQNTAGFANVRTVRAALCGKSGTVALTNPGRGAWAFRLEGAANVSAAAEPGGTELPVTHVRAVTVQDLIEEFGLDRIDLLKVDIEGGEKDVFSHAEPWIEKVEAICLELHDRFMAGCSRAFFTAVEDFPIESWRGEDVLVARDRSAVTRSPAG